MERKNNNNNKSNLIHSRMVRIDEDELECLRRLAEPSVHTRMVRIDEDELECLRKLAEDPSSNNNSVFNDEFYQNLENKKVVTQVPEKKLESKKSEDINESAEKFIQKFKHQLLLQRLDSIENVEKMLERGL